MSFVSQLEPNKPSVFVAHEGSFRSGTTAPSLPVEPGARNSTPCDDFFPAPCREPPASLDQTKKGRQFRSPRASHPHVSAPSRFARSGTTSDVTSENPARLADLCLTRSPAGRPHGEPRTDSFVVDSNLRRRLRLSGRSAARRGRCGHAAVADFFRTLGRRPEAEHAFQRAIELATKDPERRFLEHRLP